jgi:hypothetical protein
LSTDYTSLEEGVKKVTGFENTQSEILHSMIQEAYDFANHKPEKVHVYFQIGNGVAGAGFLFEIAGRILEVSQMTDPELELGYDLQPKHQQQLMNAMSQKLLTFISHCVTNNRPLPAEVWTSAVIKPADMSTSVGFNVGRRELPVVQDAVTAWKKDLEDPSYAVIHKLSALESVARTTLEF